MGSPAPARVSSVSRCRTPSLGKKDILRTESRKPQKRPGKRESRQQQKSSLRKRNFEIAITAAGNTQPKLRAAAGRKTQPQRRTSTQMRRPNGQTQLGAERPRKISRMAQASETSCIASNKRKVRRTFATRTRETVTRKVIWNLTCTRYVFYKKLTTFSNTPFRCI